MLRIHRFAAGLFGQCMKFLHMLISCIQHVVAGGLPTTAGTSEDYALGVDQGEVQLLHLK